MINLILMFGLFIIVLSILNLIFISKTILSIFVSLEMIILSLFLMVIYYYIMESIMEVLMTLVLVVGESVLGLVLLIIKVMWTGEDFIKSFNVY